MGNNNWWVAQQKLNGAKKRILKLYPDIPETTGIYILTRTDENGFRFGYVGQTKSKGGILKRMAEHLLGYDHIDLSLKKHKFIGEQDYGYNLEWHICDEQDLDNLEQQYIFEYANMGYQMRNKTIGGQGKGKSGLNENKASRGYYDGVKQGYANCLKDIKEYFDKYFVVVMKGDYRKKDGSVKELWLRKAKEFQKLLEGKEND